MRPVQAPIDDGGSPAANARLSARLTWRTFGVGAEQAGAPCGSAAARSAGAGRARPRAPRRAQRGALARVGRPVARRRAARELALVEGRRSFGGEVGRVVEADEAAPASRPPMNPVWTFLPPARTGVSPSAAAAATAAARAIRTYLRPRPLNCLTPGSFLGHGPSASKDLPRARATTTVGGGGLAPPVGGSCRRGAPPARADRAGPTPTAARPSAPRGPPPAPRPAPGSPFDGRRSVRTGGVGASAFL